MVLSMLSEFHGLGLKANWDAKLRINPRTAKYLSFFQLTACFYKRVNTRIMPLPVLQPD